MKLARIFAFAIFLAPFAHADGEPVNMVFNNVNGANDGHYYVSPYYGTMGTQSVVLFCDDIKNEISFGEKWSANVTNLGTALSTPDGFANTRYGGVTGSPVFSDASVAYQEAAWLTTQFASNPGDWVNLQYALWDVMNPGTYGNPDVTLWLNKAENPSNYTSIDPNNFEIITNVGPLYLTGQEQEFIVQTPEPGTVALLLCGALMLVAFSLLRALATAAKA